MNLREEIIGRKQTNKKAVTVVTDSWWVDTKKDFQKNSLLYLMVLPTIIFYLVFSYVPMYGVLMAFKNFSMNAGQNFVVNVAASPWAGLKYFEDFFKSTYFSRVMVNTAKISLSTLIVGFPAPIILALLINEIKNTYFKKTVQTLSYLPHFISLVVVCGMIKDFTSDTGIISIICSWITGSKLETMLNNPRLFLPVYVTSDVWQEVGWGSIIYLAALAGVDQELYEAAVIDGANRWKQTIHITLPCLMSTIIIMLILRMGGILNVGYEKIILLYNQLTRPAAEVISSFTYQRGLIDQNWSYSAAVGLFNAVINFFFLVTANWIAKKSDNESLW